MRVLMLFVALIAAPLVVSVAQQRGYHPKSHHPKSDHAKPDQRRCKGDDDHDGARRALARTALRTHHDDDEDDDDDGDDEKLCAVLPPPPPPPPPSPATVAIEGTVLQDVTFTGLANWVVQVGGAGTASAVTDAGGHYTITGLPPGSYSVCVEVQPGWVQTQPTTVVPACANGMGHAFTLLGGVVASFVDFVLNQ